MIEIELHFILIGLWKLNMAILWKMCCLLSVVLKYKNEEKGYLTQMGNVEAKKKNQDNKIVAAHH